MKSPKYIYLHGFASSPGSNKAQYLRDRFEELNIYLNVLDLNQNDFANLTLSRQIAQTASAFPDDDCDIILLGSSFGGLTAAWVAEKYQQVKKMVLLAPAFGFPDSWLQRLGEEAVNRWQITGQLEVYHYGEDRALQLNYQFVTDAKNYQESQLTRPLPCLILHGLHDDVVPIAVSRHYGSQNPQAELIELASDHGLGDVKETIWQEIQNFCNLK